VRLKVYIFLEMYMRQFPYMVNFCVRVYKLHTYR